MTARDAIRDDPRVQPGALITDDVDLYEVRGVQEGLSQLRHPVFHVTLHAEGLNIETSPTLEKVLQTTRLVKPAPACPEAYDYAA